MIVVQDKRLQSILNLLSDKRYITSNELAKGTDVSEKTVRIRIKELNYLLTQNGARIISKQHLGYTLELTDYLKFQEFKKGITQDKEEQIPSTCEERIQYLLSYLLKSNDYIKLDDIAEFIYISKNTLTKDLKKVEFILGKYNIKLIRKPNYGIKVEGKEFDKRLCIANCLIQWNPIDLNDFGKQQNEIQVIGKIVLNCINQYVLGLSEMSFQNLIIHIYVALERIGQGCPVEKVDLDNFDCKKEFSIAKEIANKLEVELNIAFPISEVYYIAIHIAGKRVLGAFNENEPNLVIPQQVDDLVSRMLEIVYDTYKIDFRHNLEIRMSLSQHIVPLDIRLNYDMIQKNPLLNEIKQKYIFAFTIASEACIAIKEFYKKDLSEDEISYFALLFALGLEKNKNERVKKNILFVCSSGKASAQLLAYKYKEEFKNYIDYIQICDAYSINKVNFDNFDYVFTTIHIKETIPLPILEVNMFLDDSEISTVKEVLRSEGVDFLYDYYDEKLFYTNVQGKTKEEVIRYMCDKIALEREIPDNFYEAVLKRENLAETDYGNLIALPHPYEAITKDTFVCVGILEEPIIWTKNQVQVVFLVSIADKKNNNLQKFYELTTGLILKKESVEKLIEEKNFYKLIQLLN